MISVGKCPGCDKMLSNVIVENMPIHEGFHPKWHGVSYICPHCSVILGVQLCELARNNDPLRGAFRVQSRPL
jgi:hypothetical protein